MRKIPSLFVREFENHTVKRCLDKFTEGCEWVINGEGYPTEKLDGTCCLIQDYKLYKRYDAKQGKKPPKGAIPCQPEPDPITTHWPHWVLVDRNKPEDKWYVKAFDRFLESAKEQNYDIPNNTYELIGPHFQSNPYNLEEDEFRQHGDIILSKVPRDYEGIKDYLCNHYMEGIVFWSDLWGTKKCKIKRTDFGFDWNGSTEKRKKGI